MPLQHLLKNRQEELWGFLFVFSGLLSREAFLSELFAWHSLNFQLLSCAIEKSKVDHSKGLYSVKFIFLQI